MTVPPARFDAAYTGQLVEILSMKAEAAVKRQSSRCWFLVVTMKGHQILGPFVVASFLVQFFELTMPPVERGYLH
jgi:ABC-type bacteriocin/lantibiotic exporter with double-glycine peptidase domain